MRKSSLETWGPALSLVEKSNLMAKERSCWEIKDEAILKELVSLIGLSAEEQGLLGSLAPQAQQVAAQMTEAFYQRLNQNKQTAEFLEGKSSERMQATLNGWFVQLFSGQYDEQYAQQRLKIGNTHVLLGLPIRYPLAMLDVIMEFGEKVAAQSAKPAEASRAFRKILALDVAVFNQSFEDNQLKHLAQLVGAERLARMLLTGIA